MSGNSRLVESIQIAPHAKLRDVVLRHCNEPYRRKPSDFGRRTFDAVVQRLTNEPFILDSGCGTGMSTFALAREFPQTLVLGVDKSRARLAIGQRVVKEHGAPTNAVLVHCELVDFWQLAAQAGLRCERQFLLYPNPWPKPAQLKRRWHAHPIFPALIAVGGIVELRTNWRVYAEEFAEALRIVGIDAQAERFSPNESITPFEAKYFASGHILWRCVAQLPTTVTNLR
jgi:tRNA (guanine-N7-)-methyltransferase